MLRNPDLLCGDVSRIAHCDSELDKLVTDGYRIVDRFYQPQISGLLGG